MASGALTALLAVRPQLHGVVTAGAALGLRTHELLHAGPPLRDPRKPPRVLASSIVMTCLHEGWASNVADAEKMLSEGALKLSPAQDRRCVTPLAAIVSPRTPLFEVRDAGGGGAKDGDESGSAAMFSPVSTVGGVDTRMGARDAGLLARLRRRDTEVASALQEAIERRGPMALWPIAAQGLAKGDDLHSRTAEANAAFVEQLAQRDIRAIAGDIAANPLFFLTLWMAASALILRTAEGGDLPSLVTRAGGNGEQFAVSLAGRLGQWVSCDAEAPRGALMASLPPGTPVSGAIGDSAVIDMLGFGGQRLAHAPEPLGVFESFLPPDHAVASRQLLSAPQPLLADAWPLGLDAARLVDAKAAPWVTLAMLADDGVTGFAGRGIYRPPVALFENALRGLG